MGGTVSNGSRGATSGFSDVAQKRVRGA